MTLDDLLTEITEASWLFNNCYQVDSHLWRVNLRRPDGFGDYFTDWAEASTLHEALAICMDKLATAEWEATRETKTTIDPTNEPTSLLARLGLNKPKLTLTRRI